MNDAVAVHALHASMPALLQGIDAADEEMLRIANEDVRRRVRALAGAARVTAIAMGNGAHAQRHVDETLQVFARRVEQLTQSALAVIGLEPADGDYEAARLGCRLAMLDVASWEWQWSQINPQANLLPPGLMTRLVNWCIALAPERFIPTEPGWHDPAVQRRLCVLDAAPRLQALINLFDFYRSDLDALSRELMTCVTREAERLYTHLRRQDADGVLERDLLVRAYGVSTGLMCETYKRLARDVVQRLHEMPELDRSLLITRCVSDGGLSLEDVRRRHAQAVAFTLQLSDEHLGRVTQEKADEAG